MTSVLLPPTPRATPSRRDGLAIVAMDCLFPDAVGVAPFWQNILERHCSIRLVGERSLPEHLRSQVESRLSALMPTLEVRSQQFRLPPSITRNFDPRVLPMLEIVRRVLNTCPDIDHQSLLTVLCTQKMMPREQASTSFERRLKILSLFDEIQVLQKQDPDMAEQVRGQFSELYDRDFPNPGFEGFLAESASLMTSIIPKTFNLAGGHIAIDATCASVICALQIAWDAIESGHNDAALIVAMSPEAVPSRFAHYSQLGIFTRQAVLPFDEAATGSALGEGIGVMLVRRLSEAEAAGNPIHAVVRGIGFSSDGIGSGFVAPKQEGQVRAMQAAYRMAAIDPRSVRLVEAHATGAPKGDTTELSSMGEIFGTRSECDRTVYVGSVKGNIGHLLEASGMAGIFKTATALTKGIIPPTLFQTLLPELRDPSSRFSLLAQPLPWPAEDQRRLAAVSSFGFGGVNAHIILEAHPSTAENLPVQPADVQFPVPLVPAPEDFVSTEVLTATHDLVTPATSSDWEMLSDGEVEQGVLAIIATCTGYEVGELQLDHDLDADLGVDSIKHMEILLSVGEQFRVQAQEGDQITDYPTIARLVELATNRQGTASGDQNSMMAELMAGMSAGDLPAEAQERLAQMGLSAPAMPEAEVVSVPVPVAVVPTEAVMAVVEPPSAMVTTTAVEVDGWEMLSDGEVEQGVLAIIATCTGYEVGELQLDHDLDADLGVDSIKHMEILLSVGEQFRVQAQEGDQITDYPTIARLVELATNRQGTASGDQNSMMAELMAGMSAGDLPAEAQERLAQMGLSAPATQEVTAEAAVSPTQLAEMPLEQPIIEQEVLVAPTALVPTSVSDWEMLSDGEVEQGVLAIIATCTGYEVGELQLDHDLDADLGVDSIKHMEILLSVGEQFRVQAQEGDQITDYPTIARLVELATNRQGTASGDQNSMMAELMAGMSAGDLPAEAQERLAQMGLSAPAAPEAEVVSVPVPVAVVPTEAVMAVVEPPSAMVTATAPLTAPEEAETDAVSPVPTPAGDLEETLARVQQTVATLLNYESDWVKPHLRLCKDLGLSAVDLTAVGQSLGLEGIHGQDWTVEALARAIVPGKVMPETPPRVEPVYPKTFEERQAEDWVLVLGMVATTDGLAEAVGRALEGSKGNVLRLGMPGNGRPFAIVVNRSGEPGEIARRIEQAAGRTAPLQSIFWGEAEAKPTGAMAWLFPGSGSLYAGALDELSSLSPVAGEVLQTAGTIYRDLLGQDLHFETDTNPLLQRPATVSVSAAMARLLESFGPAPDLVAGHSVGELTACYMAGAIDLAQLIRLTLAPFKGMTAYPEGAMAAIIGPEATTIKLLGAFGGRIVVSNRNSSQQLVVSGRDTDVVAFMEEAKRQGLKPIRLDVRTAYHSPLLAEAHGRYRTALEDISFAMPKIPVISGLTGDLLPFSTLNPAQTRALLDCAFIAPVNHVGQLRRLQEMGTRVVIDLGPTDRLSRLAKDTLDSSVIVLAASRAKRSGRLTFLEILAQLHVLGYPIRTPQLPSLPTFVPATKVLAAAPATVQAQVSRPRSVTTTVVAPANGSQGTGGVTSPSTGNGAPANGNGHTEPTRAVANGHGATLAVRAEVPSSSPTTPTSTRQATAGPSLDLLDARPTLLDPIAVVGMGALLPDANNVEEFWQNLIGGHDAVREFPQDLKLRWRHETFYNPDPRVPDKTYSKIGAFVPNFEFKPIEFRVTPKTAIHMDRSQKMALLSTREAFKDSGYNERAFNRKRVRVIIGTSVPEWHDLAAPRLFFDHVAEAFQRSEVFQALPAEAQKKLLDQAREDVNKDIPACNEDSMPGGLPNIVAGRIAFCFDLQGGNVVSDAACAASFAALDGAVKALRMGEIDMVVMGGSDSSMGAGSYVGFCKTYALSAKGSYPFDSRADGFVMGEGAGIMLLKRLVDAERENDKIYAVIRGIGSSSDGRGRGITAPSQDGQVHAMERAYDDAGVDPATIGFVEAHGTSTPLGDATEFASLVEFFGDRQRHAPMYLGSVKSMIGHLKTAAGVAGLIKAALAVKHGQIPPTLNFESPNPKIDLAASPFTVNTRTVEWTHDASTPRRAAANCFGFGGTNFHVIVEAYDRDFYRTEQFLTELRSTRIYREFYRDLQLPTMTLPVAAVAVTLPTVTLSVAVEPTAAPAPVGDLIVALRDVAKPLTIVEVQGEPVVTNGKPIPAGFEMIGRVRALGPEDLGAASFRRDHNVRFNYVAGAMAAGIGSANIVVDMAKAGMLGFFGSGGVPLDRVEKTILEVRERLAAHPQAPFGFNLLHNPIEAGMEDRTIDLYLKHGVRKVSASAYLRLMPTVVRYRATGMTRRPDGSIHAPNSVFAKVSSPEVAAQFMAPPPMAMLKALAAAGRLTAEEAELASQLPVASDITAEADSGGHTDRRPLSVLLPQMLRLRDQIAAKHGYWEKGINLRIGAAGGIGDPLSARAAFALGADYILTGSINQTSPQAGTSDLTREMLTKATMTDVVMAPAADMFEMGVQVQILKRGSFYAQRARKLYEIYKTCESLEAIPETEQVKLERDIFRQPIAEVWENTRQYWEKRDPKQMEKALADPKHKMALTFRAYLGLSSRWAQTGQTDRKSDYQIWCGPSMGLFNHWVAGTWLEPVENRDVALIGKALMHGAAVLTRAERLAQWGVAVPSLSELSHPAEQAFLQSL